MKKLQKIKLQDLVDKSTKINVNEMQKIVGGVGVSPVDGCHIRICGTALSGSTSECNGGRICTISISGGGGT